MEVLPWWQNGRRPCAQDEAAPRLRCRRAPGSETSPGGGSRPPELRSVRPAASPSCAI
ncbi:hypothetical protein B484DRAFT_258690 [Ochromonadaceae sp. CCMP2298]|nr:hypothetical protein B484DRAFT_33865 [Ochromonadaceae sp. CCMP2298]KAJ1436185.1 hypothetical protein B484DRAFT_258690 [Ochromonadaceae sp. CCMP2298]